MIGQLCLTITAALIGAVIGRRIKLPAAFMTGSMIAVIVFNYFTNLAYCPTTAKPFVQLIAGAFIAMGITKQTVRDMKLIIKPLIMYLICLIIWALTCGFLMHIVGRIDPVTAFLSCVPGGLTDISLISMDMGANTPQVTTLQTIRMIMAVGLFPILTRLFVRRFGKYFEDDQTKKVKIKAADKEADAKRKTWANLLISLGIAMIGGIIGQFIGFPSATLTGAMIAAAIWNIYTGKVFIPTKLRWLTQVVAGCMVGAMVTRADIHSLSNMIVPFFIIVGEYLIFDFVIAPLFAKVFHIDLVTMILACTPAGASDMALIAGDMGGEISEVAVFHVARLGVVLTVLPAVITWLAGI